MINFFLGVIATLVFLFIFGALAVNQRDDDKEDME